MSVNMKTLLEQRISADYYDKQRLLSDAQISELVRLASLAPSAYHLQNWQFIAVRTPQAKIKLQEIGFGQQKIADAAVTFIICGSLQAHEQLAQALQPSVEAGIMPANIASSWVHAATQAHSQQPQLQRDEAIRSASLAAMTLMLAAEAEGWVSGAVGGFDAEALSRAFALDELTIPVMLVTVGYAAEGNWRQKLRKPVEQIMRLV